MLEYVFPVIFWIFNSSFLGCRIKNCLWRSRTSSKWENNILNETMPVLLPFVNDRKLKLWDLCDLCVALNSISAVALNEKVNKSTSSRKNSSLSISFSLFAIWSTAQSQGRVIALLVGQRPLDPHPLLWRAISATTTRRESATFCPSIYGVFRR